MDIAKDRFLGESNYNAVSVGDIVSWSNLKTRFKRVKGLVLKKYVWRDKSSLISRRIGMVTVVEIGTNQKHDILTANVKIESKKTT